MHPYAFESPERFKVPFYLAGAAIALTYAMKLAVEAAGVTAAGAYIPSGFVIYGLLWTLFDRHGWRWPWLRVLGVVRTPDLSGVWDATLRSSHSDLRREHAFTLRIDQTWNTIRLTLEGERSFSDSHMAGIRAISDSLFEIRWEYVAESKIPSDESFSHRGVTMLRFTLSDKRVDGEASGHYYTQQDRETHGQLSAQRTTA